MSNSLIEGTTWHWRQGLRRMPIHSCAPIATTELYLPVSDDNQARHIVNELKDNGIRVEIKTTHSNFDVVPAGSLIVYASEKQKEKSPEEIENTIKLKKYIFEHGGEISDKRSQSSFFQEIFARLLGRGGK